MNKPVSRSLVYRFLILTIVLILLFGSATWLSNRYLAMEFREDIAFRNLQLARAIARQVSLFLVHQAHDFRMIDRYNWTGEADTNSQEVLDSIQDANPYIENVLLLSKSGKVLQTSPLRTDYIGLDFSSQPFHQEAKKLVEGQVHMSDSYVSALTGDPSVMISMLLSGNIVASQLNLGAFSELLDSVYDYPGGFLAIVDSKGVPVGHNEKLYVTQRINLSEMAGVRHGLLQEEGSFDDRWMQVKGLSSVASIPWTGWAVVVFQEDRSAIGLVDRVENLLHTMILIALFLSFTGTVLLTRRFLSPLAKMEKRAKLVAAGDYSVRIVPEYRETEKLAQSFNEMIQAIKDREEEIRSSEERFRNLFDQAADSIFIFNDRGRIVRVNREAAKGLDYSAEELLGQSPAIFLPGLSEDDVRQRLQEVKTDSVLTIEGMHQRKDGSLFPVETRFARMADMVGGGVIGYSRDISARKAAEKEMLRAGMLLATVVESSPLAMIAVDLDGTVTMWNPAAENLFGWKALEVIGTVLPQVPEDKREESIRNIRKTQKEGSIHGVEVQRLHKDGRIIPVRFSSTIIQNPEGENELLAILEDITERKNAEKALRDSEERFRSIFDLSPMGILIYKLGVDNDLVLSAANPAAVMALELDLSNTLGKNIEEVFPPLADTEVPERFRNVAKTGISWHTSQIDYDDRRIAGAYEVYAFRTEPDTVAVLFQEITERLESERQLRESNIMLNTLIDNSPLAIIHADQDFKVTRWNRSAENIFGWESREVLGRLAPFIPETNTEESTFLFERAMNGESISGLETVRLCKDGREIPVRLSTAPAPSGYGIPGAMAIIEDISKWKSAVEALRASEEQQRLILESTAEGIFGTDAAGDCIFVNPACVRMLGYSSEKDLLGKNLHDVIHHTKSDGGRYGREECPINMALKKGLASHTDEEIFWRKDGSNFPVEYWSIPTMREEKVTGAVISFLDITERRRAEKEIRDSEEKFRTAFMTSPDAINLNRLEDGMYIEVNDGFEAITGYGRQEVQGKTSIDLDIWADPKERMILINGLKENGHVANLEAKFRMKDGRTVDGLMSASVVQVDGVPCILSITRDISDLKFVEAELRESEERLRKISEGVQEGVVITEKGIIHEANEQFYELLGYTADEMIGRNLFDFVHPESVPLVMEKIRSSDESLYEHDSVRKDGTVIRTQVKGAKTTYKGRPARVTSITDITDIRRAEAVLKEREKRYRLLYENNPLGYQSLDKDGKYLEVNSAWEELTGFKRDEVLGRRFLELVHPDSRVVVRSNFPLLLKHGSINVPEIPLVRKDGHTVYISLAGRASLDEDTGKMRTHCLLQDITEQKLMESALHKSSQLAAVGQVASGIAHEINNPLATISASTEALLARIPELRKGKDTSVIDLYEDYLNMTKEEVDRSGKIMRDLQDFARMRDYTLRPVDINELVNSTVKLFSIQSRMDKYDFRISLGSKKVLIPGDRDRLRQVLVILLSNAVESMPGGGVVELKGVTHMKKGSYLLTVCDEGSGFNPEELEKVFEPFYTTRGSKGGTGLGLSIAETIVAKHGGRIEASNRKNGGAMMTVTLPMITGAKGAGNSPGSKGNNTGEILDE